MGKRLMIADAYYRLSVEDKEQASANESESITNQRNIVREYCERNNIIIAREFVDDGYSGSNFNRPGFKAMLEHINSSDVNTVITKDLSRLGRNMTESTRYAEVYFPEHDVRYIAIFDNYDSTADNSLAPFQFAMNDVYLRDTSKKIRSVVNSKQQRGEYCACPPFGYIKDPHNKERLVPDDLTAPIVQRIFKLAESGKSARAIAIILTEEKAITPLKYRVLYRDKFGEKGAARATDYWNHTTVKRILKNKVYLGHTILGKTKRGNVNSKAKYTIPEDEWIVTENTHQPLISQEQFNKAQMFMGMNTKAWSANEKCRVSIFNGLIFCSNCGAAMCSGGSVYNGERDKYWYLVCNNIPKRLGANRCEHGARIKYTDLLEVVKNELNQFICLNDDDIATITKAAIKNAKSSSIYENDEAQLAAMEKRLSEIDNIINKLYSDNIKGIIDDNRCSRMVKSLTEESNTVEKTIKKLKEGKSEKVEIKNAYEAFFKLVKKYTHIEDLTDEIVHTFIERIEVGEKILPAGYTVASHQIPYKQSVKIYYRFIGDISGDDNMKYWNDAENTDFDSPKAS